MNVSPLSKLEAETAAEAEREDGWKLVCLSPAGQRSGTGEAGGGCHSPLTQSGPFTRPVAQGSHGNAAGHSGATTLF